MSGARYRVKDGVRVVVDGTAYSNGQEFTTEPGQVRDELASGWVTEVAGKAVHGDQVEDKAVTPRRRSARRAN